MTEQQAGKIANILLGVAAVGAAYYILKTPSLRRAAWQLARTSMSSTAPGWLWLETQRAWEASAPAAQSGPAARAL